MKILCTDIVNPDGIVLKDIPFFIKGNKVFVSNSNSHSGDDIVVENSIAFPGLINVHDHLKYSWYERIGKGKSIEEIKKTQSYYNNVYEWLKDLYSTFDNVFNNINNGLDIMFQLGLYKQIFSSTTTVLNHSRHSKNILSLENQYINIVGNCESELLVQPKLISNETSHSLSFSESIQEAHNKAIKYKKAFMIHVAEGTDNETKNEINILNELGILTSQSILVHCINTDIKDIELIAKNKCTVVWCPYTSDFIIGKTADIRTIISNGINLCIGTDSSCSGSRNLLAELNYAKELYYQKFRVEISNSDLFNMVTCNPAKALMLEDKIGKIADGFSADIAVIDKKSENPYDDILSSNPENIIALWCKGSFIYGDESIFQKIPQKRYTIYSKFNINGRKKIIIGNPKTLFQSFINTFDIKESIYFDFIPKDLQLL
jgi:cytosine/adenosine deaminase-related metal-dependent hydrolase